MFQRSGLGFRVIMLKPRCVHTLNPKKGKTMFPDINFSSQDRTRIHRILYFSCHSISIYNIHPVGFFSMKLGRRDLTNDIKQL